MLEVLRAIINAETADKNVAEVLNEYFVDDLNNYAEEKARAKLVLEELSRILEKLNKNNTMSLKLRLIANLVN